MNKLHSFKLCSLLFICSHITRRHRQQFLHTMNHAVIVENMRFKSAFSKVHNVAQIDGNIRFPAQLQDELCAVIPAGRSVKHLIRAMLDQNQRFYAAGQLRRRNDAQHRTFDRFGIDNFGTIYFLITLNKKDDKIFIYAFYHILHGRSRFHFCTHKKRVFSGILPLFPSAPVVEKMKKL